MNPSRSSICGARSPLLSGFDVGINRAPGENSERSRSQSRFLPAGPEIPSYTAAIIASIDEKSPVLAVISILLRGSDFDIGHLFRLPRFERERFLHFAKPSSLQCKSLLRRYAHATFHILFAPSSANLFLGRFFLPNFFDLATISSHHHDRDHAPHRAPQHMRPHRHDDISSTSLSTSRV